MEFIFEGIVFEAIVITLCFLVLLYIARQWDIAQQEKWDARQDLLYEILEELKKGRAH